MADPDEHDATADMFESSDADAVAEQDTRASQDPPASPEFPATLDQSTAIIVGWPVDQLAVAAYIHAVECNAASGANAASYAAEQAAAIAAAIEQVSAGIDAWAATLTLAHNLIAARNRATANLMDCPGLAIGEWRIVTVNNQHCISACGLHDIIFPLCALGPHVIERGREIASVFGVPAGPPVMMAFIAQPREMVTRHEALLVVGWMLSPADLVAYMRCEDGPWTGQPDDELLACAQLVDLGDWHIVRADENPTNYYLSAIESDLLTLDLIPPHCLATGRALATLLGVPVDRVPIVYATSLCW